LRFRPPAGQPARPGEDHRWRGVRPGVGGAAGVLLPRAAPRRALRDQIPAGGSIEGGDQGIGELLRAPDRWGWAFLSRECLLLLILKPHDLLLLCGSQLLEGKPVRLLRAAQLLRA